MTNPGLLDGVKVIELTGELAGAFCAKLLADQGADTLKVEPPVRGDPARYEPPFLGGVPGPDQSSLFLAFNTNKNSVTLNLETETGRDLLLRLVADVDVVVESYPPGYLEGLGLGYSKLATLNPKLVLTSITPFGQTGPYRDYLGGDLIAQAAGGLLIGFGDEDREPMALPQDQAAITGARNGAIATMAALLHNQAGGKGQHVDVSIMEAIVQTPPGHIHLYSFAGINVARGAAGGQRAVMDGMHLETQDGYVTLTTAGTGGADAMDEWADFLELPQMKDPKFKTAAGRIQHRDELREIIVGQLKQWKSHEFFRTAMDRRFVVGVVQSPQEVLDCVHLAERGSFVEIDHPPSVILSPSAALRINSAKNLEGGTGLGRLRYPGPGFLLDGRNPMQGSRPAPRLGQHNQEVFAGLLGLSPEEIAALAAAGVI